MGWNWRPWLASAGGAILGAVAVNMVDPTVHSWSDMVLFGFWQKVVALLIIHFPLASSNWRSNNSRTRDGDDPIKLNLFDKNGEKK
jgi:hypothetical protein